MFQGSHTYENGGLFTITVIVAGEDGGMDFETTTAAAVGVGIVDDTL